VARGGHEARSRRDLLIPSLHAVQSRIGWISQPALNYVCKRLTIPPAEAYGVATFYALLALEERPPEVLHVCTDLSCRLAGAEVPDGAFPSPCLGLCERAPAALRTIAGPEPREEQIPPSSPPLPQTSGLKLLRRIAEGVDPESPPDEFRALERARELGPERVIELVKDSPLLGRGGAAFPTGVKWEAVSQQTVRPHYLVCNADESEPGTFKDRVLLENDPFATVEAMTIAAFATGASKGYLYIRGEYPEAEVRVTNAIARAREAGLLGDDILGSGFAFDIELRRGAGAYICGEETALFESIEGKRGEPRNKPPFPVEVGLFGKPTVVNNVETLANVPLIVTGGGEAFARIGTEGSTGPKLFCLSGHVARPGVYEVEFGATLGDLIELAGGVPGGRAIRTILLGGAAGVFVGPESLEMPLTFETTRAAAATLGSGVIMVFDETTDLVDTLRRIAQFFRDESCGQCVPCRVGSVRQEELLARLAAGSKVRSRDDELVLLREIGQAMRDASICGLGQTASSAIESALRLPGMVAL